MSDTAKLLTDYAETETSVFFRHPDPVRCAWYGQKVYQGLVDAIAGIRDDDGRHGSYEVQIHTTQTRVLTNDELATLLALGDLRAS